MLGEIEIFGHLTPKQTQAIESISILRRYGDGEILFYQGDESLYFHILLEGEVAVSKSASGGEAVLIHRFRAPAFIAEVATLKAIPYPASAECVGDVRLLKIRRDPFMELLHQDPALSITLISSLMHKIGVLEHLLQRNTAPSTMAKIARLLIDDPEILTRIRSVDAAAQIHTTPETFSRLLKKLKEQGIVDYRLPKFFAVLDREALLKLAYEDSSRI